MTTPSTDSFSEAISSVIRSAEVAQPLRAHTPNGFQEPTTYSPAPIMRSAPIVLSRAQLPAMFDKQGRLRRVPRASQAGSVVTLSTAVVFNSCVASAGAHVLIEEDRRIAHVVGRTFDVAIEDVPAEFRNIEAARFGVVDIDVEADAPTIEIPTLAASMSWKDATNYGVRFEIPRSERKKRNRGELEEEISVSIALGVARAADQALLSALVAANPGAFSLAAAAARGLRFDELHALVGTSASGATVAGDGVLRAAGIAAELTPDMAPTIVGAWNRAGVMVNDELTVVFERANRHGRLSCTAWVKMIPLVPDPSAFWVVP